jgi:hypothetical protein
VGNRRPLIRPGRGIRTPPPQTALSVDAAAKTITVAVAGGKEVMFNYTDATVVSGAKEGVAGLATQTKSQVTVHFTEKGQKRTATRIEVRPRQ